MKNEDFNFQPEIKSGYLVSGEIKKLWYVQLDLLRKFDEMCKEVGIVYYAQGGTLLGAVRHNGFIPWDDDIDIMMLWDDYKKMLKVAPEYFHDPYFLQSYLTEPEGEPTHSRLRRSDTTGCTRFELECITSDQYNKGIFIDIFPLFNVPDSTDDKEKQIAEILYWWKLYKGYEVHREKQQNGFSKLNKDYDQYEKLYLDLETKMSFDDIKQKYVDACAAYSEYDTEYLAPLSFRANNPKTTWPRNWFSNVAYVPFENIQLPCPNGYLEMLRFQFGAWEEPVLNGSMHEMGIYDAEESYKTKLSGIYVREYYSSDYPELLVLLNTIYDSSISQKDLEEYYLSVDRHILIAVDKLKLVGCAFLSLNRDYVRNSFTSYVTYLAVDPNHRRRGIATKLFQEIERISKGYGCTAIELTSADFRTDAHSFYYANNYTRKKTTHFIKELDL